jgi:regulator of protease activity HflC (stomatin/prohibitin superfamily)
MNANTIQMQVNHERATKVQNGWMMLPTLLGFLAVDVALLVLASSGAHLPAALFWLAVLALPVCLILFRGFFTLQPNEARVLLLFGKYRGTVRTSGLHWGNPFYANGPHQRAEIHGKMAGSTELSRRSLGRYKISLRARTLNGGRLKVNDKRGNPIEIAAVVVWRVQDTAQATFDVDDYETYVATQSESALRHMANQYPYDHGEQNESTLRSNVAEVSQALREELQERLAKAGIAIDEARLTHLAYAPEIAQAMLRRQQAEAIIGARQKIVQGAVTMVDMALRELADRQVIVLDDERKAAMVSNLMVVLCGDSEVHPVVNTGTLYS